MAKAQAKKSPAKAKKAKREEPSAGGVEVLLGELEGVVDALESGELPLEGALEHFERGVGLVKRSEKLLAGIEERVEELLADGESRVPFSVEEDEPNE